MGTVVVLGISGGRRRQRDQRLRVPDLLKRATSANPVSSTRMQK
jgi:hypothetical protein